jgi:hypothetical protein
MKISDDLQRECRLGIRSVLRDDPRRLAVELAIFEMLVQLGEPEPPAGRLWWLWGGPPRVGELGYGRRRWWRR